MTEGQLGKHMSYEAPGHYWENLELDYFMRENVTKDEKGDNYNWKDPKFNQVKTAWFGKKDMVKRALYYLKFMEPKVVKMIFEVKAKLMREESKLERQNTIRKLNKDHGEYYDAIDYVKFNDEYKPLEAKAHKEIDKIIKAEDDASKKKENY